MPVYSVVIIPAQRQLWARVESSGPVRFVAWVQYGWFAVRKAGSCPQNRSNETSGSGIGPMGVLSRERYQGSGGQEWSFFRFALCHQRRRRKIASYIESRCEQVRYGINGDGSIAPFAAAAIGFVGMSDVSHPATVCDWPPAAIWLAASVAPAGIAGRAAIIRGNNPYNAAASGIVTTATEALSSTNTISDFFQCDRRP